MKIYTLKFATSEPGQPDIVSFEAADRMAALVLGHEKAVQLSAQSWDAEHLLCTIRRQAHARDIALPEFTRSASALAVIKISQM